MKEAYIDPCFLKDRHIRALVSAEHSTILIVRHDVYFNSRIGQVKVAIPLVVDMADRCSTNRRG